MVIDETERGICYSDRVKKTRAVDLRIKFGSEKIYEPEDVAEARLQDLTAKIISYEGQLLSAGPIEEKVIRIRLAELKDQKLLKI